MSFLKKVRFTAQAVTKVAGNAVSNFSSEMQTLGALSALQSDRNSKYTELGKATFEGDTQLQEKLIAEVAELNKKIQLIESRAESEESETFSSEGINVDANEVGNVDANEVGVIEVGVIDDTPKAVPTDNDSDSDAKEY